MPMTMNERLDHARAALTAYFEAKGEPLPEGRWDYEDTDVSDLIADLLHLQKRLGLRDTERTLQTAMLHFEAEEEEEPDHLANDQSSDARTDRSYIVGSSHGELTITTDGIVIDRRLDNDDADGGRHLAGIVRFDLVEWYSHWGKARPSAFDILDLGYWYTNEDGTETYAPADAKWRLEIAGIMSGRMVAGGAEAGLREKIITVHVEGGLVQDVTGVPDGYQLRVEDYDTDDPSHPSWDAQKQCGVTTYDGDSNG